ncbi:MAG TPA: enoyl-CoA hydratase/isomerase family protein [Myxococcota bacterium]
MGRIEAGTLSAQRLRDSAIVDGRKAIRIEPSILRGPCITTHAIPNSRDDAASPASHAPRNRSAEKGAMSIDFSVLHREHHVKVEIKDGIALVTLDRPERRNAVNAAMHHGLEIVFRELSYHPDVRVIVVTGAGEVFCAGGDMKDYADGPSAPRDILRNRDLIWSMARCEAPLVSAVKGAARGVGATIALMCDICYMADTASIGDVHTQFGLPAGDGGQVIWPLLVGPNIAKEYLMRGIPIEAREAERIGLVNRVFGESELIEQTMTCAREIAARPPDGVRWTKLAVNKMILNQINLNLDFGLATEVLAAQGARSLTELGRRSKTS